MSGVNLMISTVAHNNNISSPGDGGRSWDMLSTLTYLSELFLRRTVLLPVFVILIDASAVHH